MGYKHLGRSGLKVSRLALGTMKFGWVTDEAAGCSIMDEALEQGVNLFDLTASQRALEVDLSADALHRLDEIWPGPGGEAPQAYAW
jgi:predicted aldo/keto reductase-like oxidoreductase